MLDIDGNHAAAQLAVILERDEDAAARGAPAWDGEGDVEGPFVRVVGQVRA
jgi:hypothetical protein